MSVERAGSKGSVLYRHFLACGHVQFRKRVAPASKIGCTECENPDYSATDQINMERLRLMLASRLKINPDDVILNVQFDGPKATLIGANVFLDRSAVTRLAR